MLSGDLPSLATLAAADLDARGEVGDSDPVQAVEDTLRSFPAQEVVFVTGAARARRRGGPPPPGPPRRVLRRTRRPAALGLRRAARRRRRERAARTKVSSPPSASTSTLSPSRNSPSSSFSASLSMSCRWITRFNGRAP